MKRDLDLIRDILVQAEESDSKHLKPVEIEGRDRREIFGHVQILQDEGLVKASFMGGPTSEIHHLTWQGHDYLEAVRDPGVWGKVAKRVKEEGGTITFEILKAWAIGFGKEQLGMGAGE
jgi:hypothetical protein